MDSQALKSTRRILFATGSVAVATGLVKVFSFIKDIVVASIFGTSQEMDLFVLALTIPSFVVNVLVVTVGVVLLPALMEVKEQEGSQSAQDFAFSAALLCTAFFSLVTLALLFLTPLAPLVLGEAFGSAVLERTLVGMCVILMPVIVLNGAARFVGVLLNARGTFFWVALAPALIPVTTVAAALFLSESLGIKSMAYGVLAGYGLELLVVVMAAMTQVIKQKVRPRMRVHPAHVRMSKQYLALAVGAALTSSATVVDQVMASWLGAGNTSALSYGMKLVSLFINLITVSLGVAILPHLATLVAEGKFQQMRSTIKRFSIWLVLATVPVVAICAGLSRWLVETFFERGAFSIQDTFLVSEIQAVFMLLLPFYSLGILLLRGAAALQANQHVLLGALFGVAVNIGLNYLLMGVMGVVGIAVSTVVVQVLSCIYLWIVVFARLKRLEAGETL